MTTVHNEIFTVGHSTHSIERFLEILSQNSIELVADVRRFPGSRRHPQFKSETLSRALDGSGIGYLHLPALGGRRQPRADSSNDGWNVDAFRGYADYMTSEEFSRELERLTAEAERGRTACMCAEGLWWRCHRRLLSDALVVRRWTVRHIMPGGDLQEHELTGFALVQDGEITYPKPQESAIARARP